MHEPQDVEAARPAGVTVEDEAVVVDSTEVGAAGGGGGDDQGTLFSDVANFVDGKILGPRLRDPAFWLALVTGISSRNLGHTFLTTPILNKHARAEIFYLEFLP